MIRSQRALLAGLTLLAAAFAGQAAWALQAQPVPIVEDPSTQPQLEIAGTGIGSLSYGQTPAAGTLSGPTAARGMINFSDSDLRVGAAQKLFRNGAVGSFGLGGMTTETGLPVSRPGTSGTSLFLNQAYLDYQSASFEAIVGRTDSPTAHLVDFPTLRGDDLMPLLKLPQSQRVGWILNALMEEVIDDPEKNEKKYLEKRAKELNKLSDAGLQALFASAQEKKREAEGEMDEDIKKKHHV